MLPASLRLTLSPSLPFTDLCLDILIRSKRLPHSTTQTREQVWLCVFTRQIMSHRGLPKLKLYGFPYLRRQDASKLCPL